MPAPELSPQPTRSRQRFRSPCHPEAPTGTRSAEKRTYDAYPYRSTRSPIQTAALACGAVFLLVGMGGFIPGITTDYDTMRFSGHHSQAMLLGAFQVSVLHNVVHLLYGGIGMVLSGSAISARCHLLWGGVVYLGLWIYGLLSGQDSAPSLWLVALR